VGEDAQLARGGLAIATRHLEIHHYHIASESRGESHRLCSAGALKYDDNVGYVSQNCADASAHDRLLKNGHASMARSIMLRPTACAIRESPCALSVMSAHCLSGRLTFSGYDGFVRGEHFVAGMRGAPMLDPTILAWVGLMLFGVCVLASYLPARAAARIDPAAPLRDE
jgi:hypothetical protein